MHHRVVVGPVRAQGRYLYLYAVIYLQRALAGVPFHTVNTINKYGVHVLTKLIMRQDASGSGWFTIPHSTKHVKTMLMRGPIKKGPVKMTRTCLVSV